MTGDVVVRGRAAAPRRSWFWRALGLLTGLTLLYHLGALVMRYLLGYRQEGTLTLTQSELRYKVQTELLGRPMGQREERIRLGAVSSATRELAEGSALMIIGVLMLAFGATLGTILFGDGLAGRSGSLALLGMTLVAGGRGRRARGSLRQHPPRRRPPVRPLRGGAAQEPTPAHRREPASAARLSTLRRYECPSSPSSAASNLRPGIGPRRHERQGDTTSTLASLAPWRV